MGRCKRTKPYVDFIKNAVPNPSGNFAESDRYFYSIDGLRQSKKSGTMVDKGRRKALQGTDMVEVRQCMRDWGLL